MTAWPIIYTPNDAPPEMLALIHGLMPLLVVGDQPFVAALRLQYEQATLSTLELTGVGFFANFEVPDDVSRTSPLSFTGGNAVIELEGLEHGAGCVLFVRQGLLRTLEGYTYGVEEWPEHPKVTAIRDVSPVAI